MLDYEKLSTEDKKRHDDFCLAIAKTLKDLQGAAESVVEVIDSTKAIFASDAFNNSLIDIKL